MRHYDAPEEELHERSKARDFCMKRLLPDVPQERLESVFLDSLKNRNAYMDDAMLRCEAKGGTHVLFEGLQRPEFLRCLSGRRERPHMTELYDTSTVYDNPDPNEKVGTRVA
ncbi:hypothetical protein MRX96_043888 [Rhipicephalus microplus]